MSNIAFVWDNFGPNTTDECEAVAAALGMRGQVIGIELFAASGTYEWGRWEGTGYVHDTLFDGAARGVVGTFRLARAIVASCRKHRAKTVFLCHYADKHILLAAIMLRMLGRRVFVLSDSKFDDYTRHLRREIGKALYMAPYHGGIAASSRCADYMRFLGVAPDRIRLGYYGIRLDRIRESAALPPAPEGVAYDKRHFLSIARLVPKKNHVMMIEAYARYRDATPQPRKLILCGSGPLEADIRAQIARLGLAELVEVRGNVSPADIPIALANALCLLLPSVEEQFGIVVVEAQAMGLPVILSENCGARDRQVRDGIEGFVVESDNPQGLAWYMGLLSHDEALWRRMSIAATAAAETGAVEHFVLSVLDLAQVEPNR